eukprot:TRINITY_DN67609_c0_g1_i2.p2 TRINITY_DN67609_c0_g1~~TRINITY_DN67609_c0_g1_i2.p2  ORF type:complete len:225 (-),score=18.43 TRINITY_DN67609_c0_g1_i2:181-855(-)
MSEEQRQRSLFKKFQQHGGDKFLKGLKQWRLNQGEGIIQLENLHVGDLVEWCCSTTEKQYVPLIVVSINRNDLSINGRHRRTREILRDSVPIHQLRPAYPFGKNWSIYQYNYFVNGHFVDWYDENQEVWRQGQICETDNDGGEYEVVSVDFGRQDVQEFVQVHKEIKYLKLQFLNGDIQEVQKIGSKDNIRISMNWVLDQWTYVCPKVEQLKKEIQHQVFEQTD